MSFARRLVVFLLLLALLGGAVLATPWVVAALRWMEAAGPLGHAVFVVFYVACSMAFVPASLLEGSAGFLYGPVWGIPIASALGTLGGCASFLLGRTLLRSRVERRAAEDPRWASIDRALAEHGPNLVFWLRVAPLAPFNALHLPLGTTSISLREFALATCLGHLFPVVVFVWTGSTVESLTALAEGRPAPPAWASVAGLLVTVAATVGVTRVARRVLARTLEPAPAPVAVPEG